ncbi:hypothetical protein [Lacrimispora algidixylanolytica]|uniref:Uncharacterized protein n=1 Tax=Lacrimispora algidixylanolytica TaxID=94868 RepID=A0A419T072_9FIRM|nr:hypothetical protein [Lacrimispora algidixylanolytica]RKD30821.1 hypothetical protein BET01_05765 [Lacrimispora algidixylanolytica]
MSTNTQKMEVLLISKYCHIVIKIIGVHKNLSVNKTLFFAYLLNKSNFNYENIYRSNTSVDILLKCISQITGNYHDYCKSIEYITKAIHLLITNGQLIINGNELIYNNEQQAILSYGNIFIENAINKCRDISDRQFMKEVISNV